jgi:hypothetical protein
MRGGELRLAKADGPLHYVWSWPDVDVTVLNPAMVIVSREPDGRWYVTFTVDASDPEPLPPVGHAVGVDLGVKDFAVTSDGERVANPRHLERRARNLAPVSAAHGPLPERLRQPGQGGGQSGPCLPEGPQRPPRLPAPRQHKPDPLGGHDRDRGPERGRHDPKPSACPCDLGLQLGRVPPSA